MMAQDGANRVGPIRAIIFAVTEPLLQSLKGQNDGAKFPIHVVRKNNFESITIHNYELN